MAVRILHLEDEPHDAALVRAVLEYAGIPCAITCVSTRAGFVTALEEGQFDLIFTDYALPAFDGLSALKLALAKKGDCPIILIAGAFGAERAQEMRQAGAAAFVGKERLSQLPAVVRRVLCQGPNGEPGRSARAEASG
jgi:CheY-like chemotaxis protein